MNNYEKEVIRNIIYAVETGGQVYGVKRYNDFTGVGANSSNEVSITIGAGQWYGPEAKTLLNRIRTTDPAMFKKMDTAGIAKDLDNANWSRYNITPGSSKAKCIQRIIDTELGHKIQDELVVEQMENYMASAKELGVEEIAGQMMCANFKHQGGHAVMVRVINKTKKPYNLENLYAAVMTDQYNNRPNEVGDYVSRQRFVYTTLKKYIVDTDYNNENSTTEVDTPKETKPVEENKTPVVETKPDSVDVKKIKTAQRKMNLLFNSGLVVDGEWGRQCRKAYIVAIQKSLNECYSEGLVVDGEWGPKTEAAVRRHCLSKGVTNLYVKVLQIGLYAHKISLIGEIDGSYGASTYRGVLAFQSRFNDIAHDGQAGRDTFYKLVHK